MNKKIRAIDIRKLGFVLACYTEIISVANTINKVHIWYSLHYGYIYNLYYDNSILLINCFVNTLNSY